ncbi:MAG: alpha/beta hydrolase [Chloroflexi bacterium]|nr:alpha/beta hydrolase [Chloroflexota bacterium]
MLIETIKLYENRDDVTLTTYVLADSREMLNGKKRPGVLVCPGGAYLGCSDREAEPVALRFAAMGYHAFVLRYSTYFSGPFGGLPDASTMEPNPNSVHPAPVRDIGKAFLTLHTHADRWLLDTSKIAICGFSAGGHNCAMYSVYWNQPLIYEHFGQNPDVFKPAASILGYALCDYRLMFGRITDRTAQQVSDAASIAFLGTTAPSAELLERVSPVLHVSEHTPPTFLWATAADALVPVEHTTLMATALAVADVPFEVHIFEQGQHGLSLANQATAGSMLEIETDAARWVDLAEAWLKKRFALEVPPKPAWMMDLDAAANPLQ